MSHRLGCSWLAVGGLALLLACLPAAADEGDDQKDRPDAAVEMKPTEIGIRFTPKMAQAISTTFMREMKSRYELDDNQAEAIQPILTAQFVKLVSENAVAGRDLIEKMIETAIEHRGSFPKESARELGKLAQPMMPALRGFFTETSGKIGRKMTVGQRVKLTVDMAAAAAGLAIFESRMKRWSEGKVGDGANPFWDPADHDPSKAEPKPEDPNEHPDHRRARVSSQRQVEWQINIDQKWENYVDRAVEYYRLTETQQTAARAILEDCLDRAQRIKTPEWQAGLTENRIARRLAWSLGPAVSQGPWMFAVESDYKKLRKPLTDLDEELKRRLDDIVNSQQMAAARESVRKALAEKGVKKSPV
jgi:hypothetical protein